VTAATSRSVVGSAVSGLVPCTNTATIAGSFRNPVADTGGTSVTLTGTAITGAASGTIPASALAMTCTGGTIGTPTYPGTPGTLATITAL
jgi:hypothetical protein